MKTRIILLAVLFLVVSSDGRADWVPTNGPGTFESVTVFAVSGTNLFAGIEGGGVYLSTNNGTSWTEVNNGLTDGYIRSLAFSGPNLFAGTEIAGVFLSTNNGASWTEVNNGITNTSAYALAVSGTNIFAGGFGGVYLSTNNGTLWTAVNNGLNNNSVFALAVSGTNIFAGTFSGVFLSTDNGTSWTATGLPTSNVMSFAVSGTNLFAGTQSEGAYLSTNNGTSWNQINNGLPGGTAVLAFAVSGTNLFAGTEGEGVYLSANNGTSWTDASTGLTATTVYALAVSGTNLFAGTLFDGAWRRPLSELPVQLASFSAMFVSGVGVRLDWVTISEINNYGFYVQRKRPDGQAFVEVPNSFVPGHGTTNEPHTYTFTDATPGTGAWMYRLKQVDLNGETHYSDPISVDVVTGTAENNAPLVFELAQNYPNPFNPTTDVRYQISEVSLVTLKVYNVLGREVRTLVNEQLQPGRYETTFDASALASGVYLYRLQSGEFVQTRKLMLLR